MAARSLGGSRRKAFRDAAEKTIHLLADRLDRVPQAVPHLLLALDFWMEEPRRFVLAGDANSKEGRALLRAAHTVYQPRKVVLGTAGAAGPVTTV